MVIENRTRHFSLAGSLVLPLFAACTLPAAAALSPHPRAPGGPPGTAEADGDRVTVEAVQEVAGESLESPRLAVTVLGPLDGLKLSRADLTC